ncbi:putative membrane protein-like protein [Emericellopsis cladophorae]|uniref:Membrane protein-like protein n=1 Tax=Emericellopsis cladophorae TaxID=2686198 RepID=A0A9P9Y0D5_9HYPO|nr:putative membrane protein-like protein [Emericellopsis cladophorae]KAI6781030.1 putative membrane protein-like protein [Emericellopsis cladophorae]
MMAGKEDGQQAAPAVVHETDDFGLPIRQYSTPVSTSAETKDGEDGPADESKDVSSNGKGTVTEATSHEDQPQDSNMTSAGEDAAGKGKQPATSPSSDDEQHTTPREAPAEQPDQRKDAATLKPKSEHADETPATTSDAVVKEIESSTDRNFFQDDGPAPMAGGEEPAAQTKKKTRHAHQHSIASLASVNSAPNDPGVSEFSHQQVSTQVEDKKDEDEGWQTMPSYAPYDIYDDDNRLVAQEHEDSEDEKVVYGGLGGAGKGYTRVQMDDDVQSANSMDDNTNYLFKDGGYKGTTMAEDADDDARDAVGQMQATKDLLTEGQRVAYVGVVRLEIAQLVKESEQLESTRKIRKEVSMSAENTKMWAQKMMIRLYAHMDISEAEQIMIEQLAEHGVVPADLVPALHANARVKNPMAEQEDDDKGEQKTEKDESDPPQDVAAEESQKQEDVAQDTLTQEGEETNRPTEQGDMNDKPDEEWSSKRPMTPTDEPVAEPPPPYGAHEQDEVPEVQSPSQLPTTSKIDIDLRWTVLCDLFLILIADSVYDARSRVLLERVGKSLEIPWLDICRFEKRITDALELQQAAEKENWNEEEHMESRRKKALKRRYMMMGLATVGGGIVIGLSAGLAAPLIGAGLAAGLTTIGVGGTGTFLGGLGGAAIITSAASASGSVIGAKAAHRRTGAVRTFEYRPLHNNKRVNLIVSVSGWLTGKVDDVRLPFSTVDATMGDIYSVLWEPDMLRSVGDTIQILATEALTSSIQQILGSTLLTGLMGALQIPIILTKLAYLIDNPWTVSCDRAISAGKILADSLIDRNLGTRPVTLVGYSLGSRVIFSCLQELAKRGAYGLIQNVYLFGSPIVYQKEEYLRARTVVPGRFVNGYNRTDWVLGYLFRVTSGGIRRVAGLAAIEDLPWIENIDVTEHVAGHMAYRTAMPILLKECGWMVESEVFSEIEDPDPDNHTERQRELINEIEEARKKLEEEGRTGSKSRFSIFGRKKRAEKAEWELYDDKQAKPTTGPEQDPDAAYRGALFDVDTIREELAKDMRGEREPEEEELQIREIKSTLPPMKLNLTAAASSSASTPVAPANPYNTLRETRSADHVPTYQLPPEDEIQMTFDTSFNDTTTQSRSLYGDSLRPSRDETTTASRPDLKSSNTVPNVNMNNPWGDPDDDDFGKEKEISMTFA